jgi:ribosomal protein S27AE
MFRGQDTSLQKTSHESRGLWIDPEYANAWASYRRRRFVVFCLFFSAMLEIRFAYFVPGLFFALTFVTYFFVAAWLANWKCPRCGQAFFRAAFFRSLFGGRCFHCGLPKWCVSDTGDIISRPKFPFGWQVADQRRKHRPD